MNFQTRFFLLKLKRDWKSSGRIVRYRFILSPPPPPRLFCLIKRPDYRRSSLEELGGLILRGYLWVVQVYVYINKFICPDIWIIDFIIMQRMHLWKECKKVRVTRLCRIYLEQKFKYLEIFQYVYILYFLLMKISLFPSYGLISFFLLSPSVACCSHYRNIIPFWLLSTFFPYLGDFFFLISSCCYFFSLPQLVFPFLFRFVLEH